MTVRREGTYVWVTWLAKLMAGETDCGWAPWFKANHTEWVKAASDFQLAQWQAEHTQGLLELARELQSAGQTIYREAQNAFKYTTRRGLVVAGKPDLVAIDGADNATVYDVKTGEQRTSHLIQTMLYMTCLPFASIDRYRGIKLDGCVVYTSGERVPIPRTAIDAEFKKNVSYFVDLLHAESPPKRVPSEPECRYCDITAADCPDRIEPDLGKLVVFPIRRSSP
ncbi:MAG TPA: PD-(D/E)XK nuclease family protein [Chloroflexota bacterium]|nr:PD-(D/E)XK nuclease family protein [Chloroflexota bacterium]